MMITQYLQYHAATLIDPASVGMSVWASLKLGARMIAKFKEMDSSAYLDAERVTERYRVLRSICDPA